MLNTVVASVLTLKFFSFRQACIPSHVLGTLMIRRDRSKSGSKNLQRRYKPAKTTQRDGRCMGDKGTDVGHCR